MGKRWKAPKLPKIKKPRTLWGFDPSTRVHGKNDYVRNDKDVIENALNEMEVESEEISKELSLYDEMMLGCDDDDDDYKYEEFERLTNLYRFTDKELKVKNACKEVDGTYANMSGFVRAYENLPQLEIIVEVTNPNLNNWIPNSWDNVPIKFKHVQA